MSWLLNLDVIVKPTYVIISTLIKCIRFETMVLVAQSCPTLCEPMDCSPPGSSVYGVIQARPLVVSIQNSSLLN